MCTITTEFKGKSFTGYKYALKKDKKYYSPATGVEYKVGPVPRPRKQKRLDLNFAGFILNKKGDIFRHNFYGKTAVFIKEDDARRLRSFGIITENGYSCLILKMTISGNLYSGTYGKNDIVAGEHIDKIEEL